MKLVPFDFAERQSEYSDPTHPLYPIAKTGGLVFLITPNINETTVVNYTSTSMVYTNEEFNTYQNTSSRVITLSDVKFPCDTWDNSRYALAALHFFRSYSYMDYGQTPATGRPPSPMWLSGLGDYLFKKTPCLYHGYDFSINNMEQDLVGIPNPSEFDNYVKANTIKPTDNLKTDINTLRGIADKDTNWLPIIMTFGSIQLKVQHTPNFWKKQFSLSGFRKGKLLNDF